MKPSIGDAKVDKILTQFSQMYRNEEYINELICPKLKVKEKSGKFAKYGKENLRTYTDQILRAPGVRANSVDYTVSQGTYLCAERALEKGVPDEFLNNTDDPYDAKRDAATVIMDNEMVNQEKALQTFIASTTNLPLNVTLTGTDQWNDYANSSPLTDINTAITTMKAASGKRPNTIVLSFDVMVKLKSHPDVRDAVKYTSGGQLSDSAFVTFLKDYFNLKNVFIGSAIYNSAVEGQTDVLADIWTKDAWLFYINDKPTLQRASFGYTFEDVPRQVDIYREEPKLQDVVRIRHSYDQNIMDTNLGYYIKNAIA